LIVQIEASSPEDEYYDSKVSVLSEMIKHHVKEEEQRGGMFTKARQSDMDLDAIGERLRARKDELTEAAGSLGTRLAATLIGRHRAAQNGTRRRDAR
jgi:hypothetical protein